MFNVKKFASSTDEALPSYYLYAMYLGLIVFFLSNIKWLSFTGGIIMFLFLILISVRELVGSEIKPEINEYVEKKYGSQLRYYKIKRIGFFVDTEEPKLLGKARSMFIKGTINENELEDTATSLAFIDADKNIVKLKLDAMHTNKSLPYINIFVEPECVKVMSHKKVLNDFNEYHLKSIIDHFIENTFKTRR